MKTEPNAGEAFERVVGIMRRLRAPGGCPWDREQTFDSIRRHTIEETYEVLEAIGNRDWPHLREELGDLLLQVVFYAEMAEETGYFTMAEVVEQLAEKLVRRHPHVFEAAVEASGELSAAQALGRWNAMKAQEKPARPAGTASRLDGLPKDLPALAEAAKLGERAAGAGFDWPAVDGVLAKVDEELAELRAELQAGGPRERLEEELGDTLLTLASLARQLQLEPESALKGANRKFRRRFQAMEAAAAQRGTKLEALGAAEWDGLWREAKG